MEIGWRDGWRKMDKVINNCMERWMDGQKDRQTDKQKIVGGWPMDEQVEEGQMDRQWIDSQLYAGQIGGQLNKWKLDAQID